MFIHLHKLFSDTDTHLMHPDVLFLTDQPRRSKRSMVLSIREFVAIKNEEEEET